MPGIQLPIGIDTVNPVPADFKYGPYASTAAAIAAIPQVLRFDGLTVKITGLGEYWWLAADLTDPGLVVKASGSGGGVVPITVVALQALVTGSSLVVGTTYQVTNAQDALGGTITVTATGVNTLNKNGVWTFLAKNGSAIKFTITGSSGSVNTLAFTKTLGGLVNLLSVPVPYNTSINQTADDVATAVNAGTGVHNVRCVVIKCTNVGAERPIIVLQELEGATGTPLLTVGVTTIVVANQTVCERSINTAEITLISTYDNLTDFIESAFDLSNNISISCSRARSLVLGYNPANNFRWNDLRYSGWLLVDSGYKDVFYASAFTSPFIMRDVQLYNSQIEKLFPISRGFSNNKFVNSNIFSNNNILNINLSDTQNVIVITSSYVSGTLIANSNTANITITSVTYGSTTNTLTANINNNEGPGAINHSLSSTLTNQVSIIRNKIGYGAALNLQSNTFLNFKVENNIINSGTTCAISSNVMSGDIIFSYNKVLRSTVTASSVNFLSLTGTYINVTYTEFISINKFQTSNITIIFIQNSYFDYFDTPSWGATQALWIEVYSSKIEGVVGSAGLYKFYANNAHMLDLDIRAYEFIVNAPSKVKIFNCVCQTTLAGIVTLNNSNLENVQILPDSLGNTINQFTANNTNILNSTITVLDGLQGDNSQPVLNDCTIINCPAVEFGDDYPTANNPVTLTRVHLENCSKFQFGTGAFAGGLPVTLTDAQCFNSRVILLAVDRLEVSKFTCTNSTFEFDQTAAPATASITDVFLENFTLISLTGANDALIDKISFVNNSWTIQSTPSVETILRGLEITSSVVRYNTGLFDFAIASPPLTILPIGFIYKKTTYSSNQLLNGVNVQMGYTGNIGAYLNTTVATINATPAAEVGVIQNQLIAETPVLFTTTTTIGKLNVTIEGILTKL